MKIKPILWIALLVCMAGIFLVGVALNLIWLGVIVEICVILAVFPDVFRERKEKFCSSCKQQYDFDNDVAYTTVSTESKKLNPKYNPNKRQIRTIISSKIRFDCVCRNCGESKSYTKKIPSTYFYDDGSFEDINLREEIENRYITPGLSVNNKKNVIHLFILGIVCIIVSVVLFVNFPGGVFPSAYTGEKNIDPMNYYGTYYYLYEDYTELQLTIEGDTVELFEKNLFLETSTHTYDEGMWYFYTAEYVKYLDSAPEFEFDGALVLQNSSKSSYWLYLIENDDGYVTFKVAMNDGEFIEFTQTEQTVRTATNDPENYYGVYEFSPENTLEIKRDKCYLTLDGKKDAYVYYYANEDVLTLIGEENVTSAIVVFVDQDNLHGYESYYLFVFDGEDLVLGEGNIFNKIS